MPSVHRNVRNELHWICNCFGIDSNEVGFLGFSGLCEGDGFVKEVYEKNLGVFPKFVMREFFVLTEKFECLWQKVGIFFESYVWKYGDWRPLKMMQPESCGEYKNLKQIRNSKQLYLRAKVKRFFKFFGLIYDPVLQMRTCSLLMIHSMKKWHHNFVLWLSLMRYLCGQ